MTGTPLRAARLSAPTTTIFMLNQLKRIIRKNYEHEYLLRRELMLFEGCQKVLDLGCGDGEFINLSPERISGIDSNPQTVKECIRRGLKAVQADATKLPFKDASFDGVHCSHLIEHLYHEDAYKMLREVGRVLKPGGMFVLSTPLLWSGFFEDFTHVKPYYPSAIVRYLVHEPSQPTMDSFPFRFQQVSLYYRFRPLWLPTRVGRFLANWLYPYHVHSFMKDAYTLALRKLL